MAFSVSGVWILNWHITWHQSAYTAFHRIYSLINIRWYQVQLVWNNKTFWEELSVSRGNCYWSSPAQPILVCSFQHFYVFRNGASSSTRGGFWLLLGRTTRLLSFDTTWTAYRTRRPTILLLLHVYSLPSNDRGIHMHTDRKVIS
jgi:hypothetical protein